MEEAIARLTPERLQELRLDHHDWGEECDPGFCEIVKLLDLAQEAERLRAAIEEWVAADTALFVAQCVHDGWHPEISAGYERIEQAKEELRALAGTEAWNG